MVEPIGPEAYRDLVRQALAEDRGRGDATSAATVAKGIRARGAIIAKSDLVVAGIDVASETFRQLDSKAVFEVRWGDGSRVQAGEVVANVRGDAHALLEGERTALEKYAVRCGGGTNHRLRLDDGILIKDNHKRLAGGVGAAATRAMQDSGGLPVVVEVETLDELDAVLNTGVPRILLDNFTTYDIREAVKRVNGRAEIEVSGGVTLERIPELATTGAQYV